MKILDQLLYQESHEWLELNGNKGKVGITDFAQDALGAIVYVELPSVGDYFKKGEVFGAIESVKSASDLYMPVSGKIISINDDLVNSPEKVNDDAYLNYLIEVEIDDLDETKDLLDSNAYKNLE